MGRRVGRPRSDLDGRGPDLGTAGRNPDRRRDLRLSPARRPRRMPQGLAPVSSARGAVRRPAGPWLGALLAVAALLAPVESWRLPGPVGAVAGSAEARAQSPATVQPGVPDGCGGWSAVDELCVVEGEACPFSPFASVRPPVDPPALMAPSTEFPEFCEETVDAATEPGVYAFCAAPLPAFVIIDDGFSCRALQLRTCEFGSRVDINWCRGVRRRSWSCPQPGAIARNEFNSCYVPPSTPVVATAACGFGSPEFVAVDCADYVGADLVDPPASVACSSYGTGQDWEMRPAANPYWCEYDAEYLTAVCHGIAPPPSQCAGSTALCLKRASGTGGCDGTHHAMYCRDWQHDYAEQHATAMADNTIDYAERSLLRDQADQSRWEGCEPCLILPFEPVAEHCPEDTYAQSQQFVTTALKFQAVEQQRDIEINNSACAYLNSWRTDLQMTSACAAVASRCGDPYPGNPRWSSTHFSGHAVTNSPVIVRLHDVPFALRHTDGGLNLGRLISGTLIFGGQFAELPGTGPSPVTRLARTIEPGSAVVTASPALFATQSYECIIRFLPYFRLVVEELWPDRAADATAIEALFGPDTLVWWHSLTPAEQRLRTEARGLPYWPDLLTSAIRNSA